MNPEFRYVRSGEQQIRVAVAGSGPLVLLVHGFPESWHAWRHHLQPIADAGFTAAAIDVRGYGGSSKPEPVEAYDMLSLVADNQAVADELGGGKAILVGHDWGAPIVWHSALYDTQRFTAVCGISIPYMGQGPAPVIDIMRHQFTSKGEFLYIVYFQDEGVAEAELEADVRDSLRKIYHAWSGVIPLRGGTAVGKKHGDPLLTGLPLPEQHPSWLPQEDLDYLVKEYEGSGFRGPLNRYRNFQRDHAAFARFAGKKIQQPALFMAGDRDGGVRLYGSDVETRIREHFEDLRGYHVIKDSGHWTQQEQPEQVSRLLVEWLRGL